MTHTPRTIQPRTWTSLALATTAAALTASAGYAGADITLKAPSETVWLAQAQGGEGGEGGARVDPDAAPDDATYLAALGFMEGHLAAGVALYRAGETTLAKTHTQHPKDEIYPTLAPMMTARGFAGFEGELAALADAVAANAPVSEVEALLETLLKATAAASEIGASDRAQLDALVTLSRTAANEYAVGVVDAKVVDLPEYQDAWGFLKIVKQRAEILSGDGEEDVAKAAKSIVGAVAETETAFGGVAADAPLSAGSDVLFGAAARIEIATLSVK